MITVSWNLPSSTIILECGHILELPKPVSERLLGKTIWCIPCKRDEMVAEIFHD